MPQDTPRLDTSGPAIVGMALAQALLARLRAKNVLTDDEADEVLDTALSGVENYLPPDDPGVQKARQIIDMIAHHASAARRRPRR
jgi:hypothetical protein